MRGMGKSSVVGARDMNFTKSPDGKTVLSVICDEKGTRTSLVSGVDIITIGKWIRL